MLVLSEVDVINVIRSPLVAWTAPLGAACARMLRVLPLVLALLPVASVSSADEPAAYVVGPNDVLAIKVIDEPQMSGTYIVRVDGTFTFPLLGRLQAAGLSLQAIEDSVRERLAKGFLKDPQVGVSVDQYRSQQILMMGEVRQPGILQFTGSMTVIEALARAGSVTERAGTEVMIIRSANGGAPAGVPPPDAAEIQRMQTSNDANLKHIDLDKLQGGDATLNVTLRSGDTLMVPRAETIFVSGQVASAGEFVLRKGMTVRQALALAGGVTDRGSSRRIQIIRKVKGVDTKVDADLQDVVNPGDTIVVRERLF